MKTKLIILNVLLMSFLSIKAQNTLYSNTKAAKQYSEYLYESAKGGHAVAQNDLGSCYDRGAGVQQDRQKAMEWFLKSAEQDYFLAHYNLAYYYETGLAGIKDYQKSFYHYSKALEKNPELSPAQFKMGVHYLKGWGCEKNKRLAEEWLDKTATSNSIITKFHVANVFRVELGKPEKALKLYEICLEHKIPNEEVALLMLATMYDNTQYGLMNYTKALPLWLRLAEIGTEHKPTAEYKVGEYYELGKGVSKDKIQAAQWYMKSAEKGYAAAMLNLSNCYRPDYDKVVYWLQKAYEKEYIPACHNLGDCYYYGNGVEKNYQKAFEIFMKGIELPVNMYRVATMYREGKGVQKNVAKAEELLLKAANAGEWQAQYLIGMDKYKGEIIPKDEKNAVKYLEMALKNPYIWEDIKGEIYKTLQACYRFKRGVPQKDIEKANMYMKKAQSYGKLDAKTINKFLRLD